MKTLREILDSQDKETLGTKNIKVEQFWGWIGENQVIITAVLERTAVVHPPGYVDRKFVANLNAVKVREEDVVWVSKSKEEVRVFLSRSRSYPNHDTEGRFRAA